VIQFLPGGSSPYSGTDKTHNKIYMNETTQNKNIIQTIPNVTNNTKHYGQYQTLQTIPNITDNTKYYGQYQTLQTIPNITDNTKY
jgi:hypothetical protein